MRAFTFITATVLLAACGPRVDDPCAPPGDGAVCSGSEVLLCVCPAPDAEGACPADDATWQIDDMCSCSSLGVMTCA